MLPFSYLLRNLLRRPVRSLVTIAGVAATTLLVVALLTIWPVTLGVEGHGIDLSPGWSTVWQSLLAALLVGIFASLPPAFAAARRPLHLGVKAD